MKANEAPEVEAVKTPEAKAEEPAKAPEVEEKETSPEVKEEAPAAEAVAAVPAVEESSRSSPSGLIIRGTPATCREPS